MKVIIVLTVFVVAALASDDIETVKYSFDKNGADGYNYAIETSDGATKSETGTIENAELSVKGSYSFVGEDGETYTVDYVADKHGFRPSGAHLPSA